uniref:myb-related transcription factor, partner of profilin-like n=1 Tax=Pristiophorus japonicus TaxID=55135 RepID=UPI00398EF961
MERHRRSRAKRFSDTALKALVHGVRQRRDVLFPQGGKKPSRLKYRRVWKEIAKAVTAASLVPRTPIQCRKKLNDLTRLVKGKVADNRGEQQQAGGDHARVDLTDLEESMFQIIEGAGTESMENGELESSADDDDDTQEPVATGPEHKEDTYGGREAQEEEEDDKTELRLTLVDASSESGTAQSLEGSTEAGSAHGESPGMSGLQPGQGERVAHVPDPRRASLHTRSAPQDSNDELDGAAFRRKVMGMHTEMLGAVASLPKSLLSVSRSMEESGSNIARCFAQSLEPMISGMEMMGSSMRDLVDPNMMVDVMGNLAASIAAQAEATQHLTAAVEAQTAAIIAGFTSVERGLQGVAAGQQSVLQQIAEFSEGCRAGRGC